MIQSKEDTRHSFLYFYILLILLYFVDTFLFCWYKNCPGLNREEMSQRRTQDSIAASLYLICTRHRQKRIFNFKFNSNISIPRENSIHHQEKISKSTNWKKIISFPFTCVHGLEGKLKVMTMMMMITMTIFDDNDLMDLGLWWWCDDVKRSDVWLIWGFSKDQRLSSHSCHNWVGSTGCAGEDEDDDHHDHLQIWEWL